ncbi:hypothetical protein P8452_66381 [Trifolium repens]|nr:hypothetical protein P8452_66381 [Trifolium repens]
MFTLENLEVKGNEVFDLLDEEKVLGFSSNKDSDDVNDEVYLQNASDEEEFHFSPSSLPNFQFRNTKSKGICNEEMRKEELEVYEKNGKMWVATGIVRNGKIYTSIEETLYLMELEAFDLLDNDD